MGTIYPILLIVVILISWVNWWFLTKWFSQLHSKGDSCIYWLITILAWLTIAYNWLAHPGTLFFSQWISPILYLSFVWIVGTSILLLLFPVLFAVRRLINTPYSAKRRGLLQNVLYVTPLLAFSVSIQGGYSARFQMDICRLTLPFKNLPSGLQGFKIAQISDTHLGAFFTLDRLDEILTLVSLEKPDIVVITGDLIDDLTLLESCIEKLSQLSTRIPYGIYFCWGNHEYFRDIKRIREKLLKSPIRILENSNVPIVVGESRFYLLGVDYPFAKNMIDKNKQQEEFLSKAQADIPEGAFRILLAHHPDFLFNAFARQIPLTLSGHTHGGQINVFGCPVLPFKYYYMRGIYQDQESYGYVNVGAGQWFPFRIGCPPEISIFTLT